MNHESLAPAVPDVLANWKLVATAPPSPVHGGTLNWNFRVETAGATYFLRCCRQDLGFERIIGEHALVAWVAARGVPAPRPLHALNGGTLILHDETRWALFPWVAGAAPARGTLNAVQVRALGAAHGKIQAVLADHPESAGATMLMRWDKAESEALLDRIIAVAARSNAETWVQDGVRLQRRLLESMDVKPPAYFGSLPCQMLHGDFHDQQVLFRGDSVAAVVDWEVWHSDPRAWEVIRSLAFSLLLDSPKLDAYAAGYREHVQLGESECRLALELWLQSRVVGCWVWAAYFLQGITRVAEFFPAVVSELARVSDHRWREDLELRLVRAFSQ